VLDGNEVIAACRRSGGTGHLVSDEAVWSMQARLAREEGIFSEPAGAVAAAAVLIAIREKKIDPHALICCLVTGVGFKDLRSLARMAGGAPCPVLGLNDLGDLQP
jgi:threonine synthase